MDKITYLAELAEGLARWVPERERQDILRYYAEYFEEAGQDREAEVVAELGDPWALSCRLAVEGGYVTHEKAASWRHKIKWPGFLIGTALGLAVFALVCGFGLLAFNSLRFVSRGLVLNHPVVSAVSEMSEAYEWRQDGAVTIIDSDNVAFVEEGTGYTEFYYTDGGNLADFSIIDVDISLGNIEVVYADSYTLSIGRNNSLMGYGPAWEVTDGVLKLRDSDLSRQATVDSWDDLKTVFRLGQWAVDVTITVPEGAALDNVSVKTGLGDVLLWGLNAETVTAETGMGDIVCYEARNVRKLGLSTGKGDVNLGMDEACDGLNVGLKTGMGDIEATLCGAEKDYYYDLDSGMGDVTVNGSYRGSNAKQKDNLPYMLAASSGMGDVSVHFTFD